MTKEISNTAFGFSEEDTTNKSIEKENELIEKHNEKKEEEVNAYKELHDDVSKKANKE